MISDEYLKIASDSSLQEMLKLREQGAIDLKKGKPTAYTEGETTRDVDRIKGEIAYRERERLKKADANK